MVEEWLRHQSAKLIRSTLLAKNYVDGLCGRLLQSTRKMSPKCSQKDLYCKMKLYSFDVFDTLITRATLTPEGVYTLMQQRLLTDNAYTSLPLFLRSNFNRLRIAYEGLVRQNLAQGVQEITLLQIYQALATDYALAPEEIKILSELEQETEYICSIPIRSKIVQLLQLAGAGEKVVIISDSVLPEIFLRRLLHKAEPELDKIALYVSSEYGKTKAGVDLFKIVAQNECAEYANWEHFGDSERADVAAPRTLGITAHQIAVPKRLAFEKFLGRMLPRDGWAQLYAGCAVLTRRSNVNCDFVWSVGASFGAPLLMCYVEWLLEQCGRRNIKRLYFVARDGYILKKMFDELAQKLRLDIKTNYFYGSRKAWKKQSEQTSEEWRLLCDYIKQEIKDWDENCAFVDLFGSGRSLETVAEILELTPHNPAKVFYYRGGIADTPLLEKFCCASFLDMWDNIELFCKSPEGQCLGYRKCGDGVTPVCAEADGKEIRDFGFEGYEQGVMEYCRNYAEYYLSLRNLPGDKISAAEWYLTYINEFPGKDLRRYLTEFPRDGAERKKFKYSVFATWVRNREMQIKKIKYFVHRLEKLKIFNLLK